MRPIIVLGKSEAHRLPIYRNLALLFLSGYDMTDVQSLIKENQSRKRPLQVCVFLSDSFNNYTISSIVEPIRVANYFAHKVIFEVAVVSQNGGCVSSDGMQISTSHYRGVEPRDIDLFILCDQQEPKKWLDASDVSLRKWIDSLVKAQVTICAIGSSVFTLASLGYLTGRNVTVAWQEIKTFRDRFPTCRVSDSIYEVDDGFVTCAGGIATMDFILQLISAAYGRTLTSNISDYLIFSRVRDPGTRQRPLSVALSGVTDKKLSRALQMIERAPDKNLSEITTIVGVSRRQLERLCKEHLGCSPVRLLITYRLDRSRAMLREGGLTVNSVRKACGFASTSHFSSLYRRRFGCSPSRDRGATPGTLQSPLQI